MPNIRLIANGGTLTGAGHKSPPAPFLDIDSAEGRALIANGAAIEIVAEAERQASVLESLARVAREAADAADVKASAARGLADAAEADRISAGRVR